MVAKTKYAIETDFKDFPSWFFEKTEVLKDLYMDLQKLPELTAEEKELRWNLLQHLNFRGYILCMSTCSLPHFKKVKEYDE